MKLWCTEIHSLDPDGEVRVYCGPIIEAWTLGLAEEYCKVNGLGYARVVGEFICETGQDEEIPEVIDVTLN